MAHSNQASLVWVTPNAEQLIADIARVSSPERQGDDPQRLIAWMLRKKHWSPFEMASMCIEIHTSRAIGRQILRHRSFSFQEFSQRWSSTSKLATIGVPKCRMQNSTSRELPTQCEDVELQSWWTAIANSASVTARQQYEAALAKGISREVARALLPEGLTATRMYMAGTFRSWIHYLMLRLEPETQAEHRDVAMLISGLFKTVAPVIWSATCASVTTNYAL